MVRSIVCFFSFTKRILTFSFVDVWLKFQEPLALRRDTAAITKKAEDYIKAYHNKGGRAVEAWAVDNNRHTISTAGPLRAGITYTMTCGGRSSNVGVNAVIMFPCEGTDCAANSDIWKKNLAMCGGM